MIWGSLRARYINIYICLYWFKIILCNGGGACSNKAKPYYRGPILVVVVVLVVH